MAPTTEEIEAQQEALAKLTEARQKDLEVLKKLDQVAKNRRTGLQREIEFYKEETKLYRTAAKDLTALLEVSKETNNEEEIFNTLRAETIEKLEKLRDLKKEGKKINEDELTQLELMEVAFNNGATSIEGMIDTMSEAGDNSANLRKVKAAAEDLGAELDKTAQSILGLNNDWAKGSLTGRMLDAIGKGASLAETFSSFGSKIKETLSPTNLLANAVLGMVKATKELTVKLSGQLGAFKETTSAGDEYLSTLSRTIGAIRGLGIAAEQAAAAVTELYMELAMFSRMSKSAQESLSETVATLEGFNVSAQTSTQVADIFMQSLGKTESEFKNLQASMLSMSKPLDGIGVSMSTLNKQMVEAAQVIGQYGEQGVEEFKKLAASAKATGIEMKTLLDIASQFDTFEEASDHVGRLNAVLGGSYFDTVQMVNATEEERIDLLRRGVQMSGKTFADLGRYEKKMIAAAAGISDVNEANKLFGTSTGVYEELQQLASDASMSLSDLSEEAFNTLGPMEKFQAVFARLQKPMNLVLKVLDTIAGALNGMVVFLEESWEAAFGKAEGGFTVFVTALFIGFFKLSGIIGGLIGLTQKAAGSLATTAPTMASSITTIGTAATASAKGLLALGAAAALIGVGIGAILFGLAQLIMSFKDLNLMQILGAFVGIGLALKLIFVGIGALIPLIAGLGGASAVAIAPILAVAFAIGLITAGIGYMMSGVADAISALADLSRSFGNFTSSGVAALAGMVSEFDDFSDIEIPVQLTAFTKELGTLMVAASKTSPSASKATTAVINAASNLAKTENSSDNTELTKALAALVNASNNRSSGAAKNSGNLEVVVNLNGKEFYKAMRPYIEGELAGKIIV
jgi:hypothetical protein